MTNGRAIDGTRRDPRALVTRPRQDAAGLVAALAERGVEAIIEPLLAIECADGPSPDLAGVQAVLCTSANGVRALARLSPERGVPLFAVGAASAAQARAAGFRNVESAGGDVGDLARLATDWLHPAAGRLLHVAGSAAAGDLAGELRAAGFAVDRAVLYEARAATALSAATAQALRDGAIDVALFFSPRTAAIFVRLVVEVGLAEAMRKLTAISISAAADAALAPLQFHRRAIAQRPDQPALLEAVERLVRAGCAA